MKVYVVFIGPVSWTSASEIPSNRLRSYTLSLAMAVCWALTALITYLLPFFLNPLELNWSGKVGYVFGGGCLLTALWQYFFLPETFNFTLERLFSRAKMVDN
jgi:Sugar (and other) transporter